MSWKDKFDDVMEVVWMIVWPLIAINIIIFGGIFLVDVIAYIFKNAGQEGPPF